MRCSGRKGIPRPPGAYRACCVIECDREGKTHDYNRKQGLEASESSSRVCRAGPLETLERGRVRGEERQARQNAGAFRANAQTARDLMFTFPVNCPRRAGCRRRGPCRGISWTRTASGWFNIHEPGKDGDQKNHHCHMLLTTRRLTANGFSEKAREWDHLKTGPKLSKPSANSLPIRSMPDWQPKARPTLPASNIAVSRRGAARRKRHSIRDRARPTRCAKSRDKPAGHGRPAAEGAAAAAGQGTGLTEIAAGFLHCGKLADIEAPGRRARRRSSALAERSARPIFRRPESGASSRSSPGRICAKLLTARRGTASALRPRRKTHRNGD